MTQIRPFSATCAIVSAPLPVRSSQATVCSSRMLRESRPRGETLTMPSADSGAVATKKTCCSAIHAARSESIAFVDLAHGTRVYDLTPPLRADAIYCMPVPSTITPPRPLLRDEVFERLRDAIVDGTLAPDEQLRDTELATWLGVSRTPVREALLELGRSGLVRALPGSVHRGGAPR